MAARARGLALILSLGSRAGFSPQPTNHSRPIGGHSYRLSLAGLLLFSAQAYWRTNLCEVSFADSGNGLEDRSKPPRVTETPLYAEYCCNFAHIPLIHLHHRRQQRSTARQLGNDDRLVAGVRALPRCSHTVQCGHAKRGRKVAIGAAAG